MATPWAAPSAASGTWPPSPWLLSAWSPRPGSWASSGRCQTGQRPTSACACHHGRHLRLPLELSHLGRSLFPPGRRGRVLGLLRRAAKKDNALLSLALAAAGGWPSRGACAGVGGAPGRARFVLIFIVVGPCPHAAAFLGAACSAAAACCVVRQGGRPQVGVVHVAHRPVRQVVATRPHDGGHRLGHINLHSRTESHHDKNKTERQS